MNSVEHPQVMNGELGIDVTKMDMHKRIGTDIWDQVVASARIL